MIYRDEKGLGLFDNLPGSGKDMKDKAINLIINIMESYKKGLITEEEARKHLGIIDSIGLDKLKDIHKAISTLDELEHQILKK